MALDESIVEDAAFEWFGERGCAMAKGSPWRLRAGLSVAGSPSSAPPGWAALGFLSMAWVPKTTRKRLFPSGLTGYPAKYDRVAGGIQPACRRASTGGWRGSTRG